MDEAAANPPEKENPKSKKKPTGPVIIPKSTYDVQRIKLERLFANPDKPVVIPTPTTKGPAKKPHDAPEFVRNVMGSSAGAGSGEFHVYRHLRRKEYARQKYIERQAREEQLDVEFKQRLEDNKRKAEERTAKKRAKRLKKKQNMKKTKKKANVEEQKHESDDESECEEVDAGDGNMDGPERENARDEDDTRDAADEGTKGNNDDADHQEDSNSCSSVPGAVEGPTEGLTSG